MLYRGIGAAAVANETTRETTADKNASRSVPPRGVWLISDAAFCIEPCIHRLPENSGAQVQISDQVVSPSRGDRRRQAEEWLNAAVAHIFQAGCRAAVP